MACLEEFGGRHEGPAPVRTKRDFYRRFLEGEFGNMIPHWPSWDAFFTTLPPWPADSRGFKVGVRSMVPGGRFIPPDCWSRVFARHYDAGIIPGSYMIGEGTPDDRLVFQGELIRDHGGLRSRWSVEKVTMREAMKNARNSGPAETLLLLRRFLDQRSMDNMERLLEEYPGHAIEWSTFSCRLGTLALNTVIWEVRSY